MKKLKLTLIFFILCSALTLLLTACDNGNKPSNKQILEDLSKNFEYDYDFINKFDEIEIELSTTGKNIYIAEVNATAKAKYADFTWEVKVEYSKYDQGWKMEECEWGDYEYKQTRYPSEKEIKEIISEINIPTYSKSNITYEEGIIKYSFEYDVDWSKYAYGSTTSVVLLKYIATYDRWEYQTSESKNNNFILSKKLEGKYKLVDPGTKETYGYVTIQNVTNTSFDLSVESKYCDFASTHFNVIDNIVCWEDSPYLKIVTPNTTLKMNTGISSKSEKFGKALVHILLPKDKLPESYSYSDFVIHVMASDQNIYSMPVLGESSKIN